MKADVRARIIEAARRQFFSIGYQAVTVDQLAAELGISKKTLYQHFPGKDELLEQVMETTMLEMEVEIRQVLDSQKDFLEKLRRFLTLMAERLSSISKRLHSDMRRCNPALWERLEEFRRVHVLSNIAAFLEEGTAKGAVRTDVNPEVFTLAFFAAVERVINPTVLTTHSFSGAQAFQSILEIFFEGILTPKTQSRFRRGFDHGDQSSSAG